MNNSNHKRRDIRVLAAAAMFTAMITVTTAYLFHIPVGGNGGYLHFGDAFIYLAACFLPWPYACGAAALGGALADIVSGAAVWVLPTAIIKPLTAIWFTNRGRLLCKRNIAALFFAGFISMAGYYLAEVVMTGSWLAPLAVQWSSVVQAAGSAGVFVAAALALDGVGLKDRLGLVY